MSALPSLRLSTGLSSLGMGLLAAACTSPVSPAEYQAYLNDPSHGLTQTREVNGTTITCSYRPTDLLVLQDLAQLPPTRLTSATRDSLRRTYAGKTYCSLALSRNNAEVEAALVTDPPAYQRALSYLNTGIAADTFLATGQDSVPALASMYLRQYGTTGHSTVLLVFATPQPIQEQGFHLTWRGHQLNAGSQRFFFNAADLAAVPPLADH